MTQNRAKLVIPSEAAHVVSAVAAVADKKDPIPGRPAGIVRVRPDGLAACSPQFQTFVFVSRAWLERRRGSIDGATFLPVQALVDSTRSGKRVSVKEATGRLIVTFGKTRRTWPVAPPVQIWNRAHDEPGRIGTAADTIALESVRGAASDARSWSRTSGLSIQSDGVGVVSSNTQTGRIAGTFDWPSASWVRTDALGRAISAATLLAETGEWRIGVASGSSGDVVFSGESWKVFLRAGSDPIPEPVVREGRSTKGAVARRVAIRDLIAALEMVGSISSTAVFGRGSIAGVSAGVSIRVPDPGVCPNHPFSVSISAFVRALQDWKCCHETVESFVTEPAGPHRWTIVTSDGSTFSLTREPNPSEVRTLS